MAAASTFAALIASGHAAGGQAAAEARDMEAAIGAIRLGLPPAWALGLETGAPTLAASADALDRLAETRAEPAFAQAARTLRQQGIGGRPAIDDSAEVAETRRLHSNGHSWRSAGEVVRRRMGGDEAMGERLRKKAAAGVK